MSWKLNSDRPIYAQIIEEIQLRIVSGEYRAGQRMPSVRELAAEAEVNPNTMQKALAEMEQKGLLYSQRTSGRFVTEDQTMIEEIKNTLAKEQIVTFVENMRQLGFNSEDILAQVRNIVKEEQ
ncbi:GntR family transcriptional regulator [Fumia xinanensis]|uniref:GntR family transcriptional regulator n=1 Tax=Fumia xinanensis TaxID=2763659 RepID=A0A926E681_9FIRM|nr:GntR family transcriptional regulator [Fumia xinanensis]MBC8560934.1 GntR family transcriptional regulator [Fumia xinanensis]